MKTYLQFMFGQNAEYVKIIKNKYNNPPEFIVKCFKIWHGEARKWIKTRMTFKFKHQVNSIYLYQAFLVGGST